MNSFTFSSPDKTRSDSVNLCYQKQTDTILLTPHAIYFHNLSKIWFGRWTIRRRACVPTSITPLLICNVNKSRRELQPFTCTVCYLLIQVLKSGSDLFVVWWRRTCQNKTRHIVSLVDQILYNTPQYQTTDQGAMCCATRLLQQSLLLFLCGSCLLVVGKYPNSSLWQYF